MRKCLAAIALCLLVLSAFPLAVSAETEDSMATFEKTYAMTMNGEMAYIRVIPETPAFWEYPVLKAGENYKEGTLIVRNDSAIPTNMLLKPIALPYGQNVKLSYLDHLMLTVTDQATGEVLFHNTYAHINDADGGLKLSLENLAPGASRAYTIRLRCLYSYAGNAAEDVTQLNWTFTAATETVTVASSVELPVWLWIVLAGVAMVILLLAAIVITRAVVLSQKRKEENNQNTH